jgi:cell division protein FtsI (penicillin-binding protein 3)
MQQEYQYHSRILQRESAEKKQMTQCRSRLLLVLIFIGILYLALGFRLLDLAISPYFEAQKAVDEAALTGTLPKQEQFIGAVHRARITDRNGVLLAGSLATRSLYANAKLIRRFGIEETAKALHRTMPDLNYQVLLSKLQSGKKFVYIKRHLTPQEQARVNDLGIPGLEFEDTERRVYPLGNLFAHVLGFVDVDNRGLAGIERYFEKELISSQTPLTLSVDERIQHIVHDELTKAIDEFKAIGGVGLSMVSLPDFDPNHLRTATPEARFNRATLGVYEMGSTFKTFTMAAALEYGTATLQSRYNAINPIRIGRFAITDSHPENRMLNVPEIYVHSSNIGTVRMIMEVGIERQKRFLGKLGLYEKMKIEMPELALPLIPNPWHEVNMMTVSYGHGISVTPLHLVRSFAALAGDGILRNPTLLKQKEATSSPTGEAIVKKEVVAQMRQLMRLVVRYGTGKKADAEGYRVGGKTGTAEKVKSGGYAGNDKIASFIGAFPMDNPRYLVLVMVDEPRGNKKTYGFATGGWVSAPVVGNIVSRMGALLAIPPKYNLPEETVSPEEEEQRKKGFIEVQATAKGFRL